MTSPYYSTAVLTAILLSVHGFECEKDAEICETTLKIEHRLTMRYDTGIKMYPHQGHLYQYDVTNTTSATPIPPGEVLVADGWEEERLVVVANRSLPGPAITVYEGQRLIVHVINGLHSDTVTIHWHGLPQRGTPWMDGVAFITQCPILPGQTFTYDFVAEPTGTFWYHSHVGSQRTKGLYGALIVRDRRDNMTEHIALVQGWNHLWSADMDLLKYQANIFEGRKMRLPSYLLDGDFFSAVLLTSALINGRGRYYSNATTGEHNGTPLTTYTVKHGQKYRFRVINADILYPFRISVDNHDIRVIATDGYEIQPVPVESFVLHSGERYDFELTADQPIGNYWIRARTMEIEEDRLHRADAILRYESAADDDPSTSRANCTASSRCLVINCPFYKYPEDTFTDCLPVDRLISKDENDPAPEAPDGQLQEHFMNFAFPGVNGFSAASVNGRQFILPAVSALTQPREIGSTCDKVDCGEEKECTCTHALSLEHNNVVQLVLINLGKAIGGFHAVHLHGYSFYVLKIGFGNYDNATGHYLSPNTDVDCRGSGDPATSFCNSATWQNRSWTGGNIPDLNLQSPPRKDTVFVPAGGYAVIRIRADNPGLWLIHCHMQVHNVEGMAMLINNSFDRIPQPPYDFPICHNFPSLYRKQMAPSTPAPPNVTSQGTPTILRKDDGYSMKTFWVTVAILGIVMLFMGAYILHLRRQVKLGRKHEKSKVMVYDNQTFE